MNKKKILIVTVIIVLVVAAYFYFRKPKKVDEAAKSGSLDPNFNIKVPDTRNDNFPLSTSSKGTRVSTLQLAVNRLIEKYNNDLMFSNPGAQKVPVLIVDSILGEQTKATILKVIGVAYYSPTGITETQFNSIIEKSNK